MPRVLHFRLHGLRADRLGALREEVELLASERPWRGDAPWIATEESTGLFEMEYLRHVREADGVDVGGAGFLKTAGDEIDALVLVLFLRDVSRSEGLRATVRDDDNPLAKLRYLEFRHGRLPSGNTLEEIFGRTAIIKKVDGESITFYPPAHRLSTHTASRPDQWGYALSGIRAYAPTLLEAEREALKILKALRHLGR